MSLLPQLGFDKRTKMEHKFNPENKKRLSGEFRKKILPASRTLKGAGLKTGMTIADIGCGLPL